MQWMMTYDHNKRPTAQDCLTHYWILDRFTDIKADNLLLDLEQEQEEEKHGQEVYMQLPEAQKNMETFKKS